MLVHICCSVDSHYFLRELGRAYPNEELVGFFYNPNIHPQEEHDLRLSDVRRSCRLLNIRLIEGDYELDSWLEDVRGFEDAPEKGARCSVCFDSRLLRTARLAKEMGIDRFTTTLLSSPMKEQEILYRQGDSIASKLGLDFVKINVRANGGVNKQNELAKADNLYRQNYCGCKFALGAQRDKQNKFSLEMLSSLNGQVMPASIESRQALFGKRDKLEGASKDYLLSQRKQVVWRLLNATILQDKAVIPSYVLARSASKTKSKSGDIAWVKPKLPSFYSLYDPALVLSSLDSLDCMDKGAAFASFVAARDAEYAKDPNLLIGYSKRDDSVFLGIGMLNFLLFTNYASTRALVRCPPSYDEELRLRQWLCGVESVNPIVVLDSMPTGGLVITINSLFQEEMTYNLVEALDSI